MTLLSPTLLRQVGEFKAHAAEWKANVRAEFRETRRRLSVEIHDKLQRAATIRNMERRRLGLDQRAHSLDMLSPEKRAVFASLDAGRFKTASQESIDSKLNNLRVLQSAGGNYHTVAAPGSGSGGAASIDNLFNRFGSLTKLAKRSRNRELQRNIPEEVRRACEGLSASNTTLGGNEVDEQGEEEEEEVEEVELELQEERVEKEDNTSLSDLPQYADKPKVENGFVPSQAKERELDKMLEGKEHQP